MDEWKDIETAPTDGTVVIGTWPGFNPDIPMHVGPMEYRTDWWWPLTGKLYTGWCAVGSGPTAKDPTGWVPMPSPPSIEGTEPHT